MDRIEARHYRAYLRPLVPGAPNGQVRRIDSTVILPEHWRQWPQAQLDAVLTHEHEHARRRDPLVQWLALLNRALFWFHPVAWWLERHLSALAEEACDNVVLERGTSPANTPNTS